MAICSPTVLISGQQSPYGVELDSSDLYWTSSSTGAVNRCDPMNCAMILGAVSPLGSYAAILTCPFERPARASGAPRCTREVYILSVAAGGRGSWTAPGGGSPRVRGLR